MTPGSTERDRPGSAREEMQKEMNGKHRKKRSIDAEDEENLDVTKHSSEGQTQEHVVDESEEPDKLTKRIRKAIKRVSKHLQMDTEDELPIGFDFPSKEDVLELRKKQRETFFDQAAASSEKIVLLTSRILNKFGHGKSVVAHEGTRLAMKGFEPYDLWRQVSNFTGRCCSKALTALKDDEADKTESCINGTATNHDLRIEDDAEDEDEEDDDSSGGGSTSVGIPAVSAGGGSSLPSLSSILSTAGQVKSLAQVTGLIPGSPAAKAAAAKAAATPSASNQTMLIVLGVAAVGAALFLTSKK